jgi:TRAP-type uncharacterized transport system substrate-binding protein
MSRRNRRPATTDENRESQLVSLAIDLAEKQMIEGTASSQVITHFLKAGSTREKIEKDRLRREVELLEAKVEGMASAKKVEELYSEALNAMKTYTGQESEQEPEEDYYD